MSKRRAPGRPSGQGGGARLGGTSAPASGDGLPPAALPKVSQTLIAFAAPLFDLLPAGASERSYQLALGLAVAVWNDSLLGGGRLSLVERELTAFTVGAGLLPGIVQGVVEGLRRRRRRHYKADHRYVVEFAAWGTGEEIRLRAFALDFAAMEQMKQQALAFGMNEEEAFAAVMEEVRAQRERL